MNPLNRLCFSLALCGVLSLNSLAIAAKKSPPASPVPTLQGWVESGQNGTPPAELPNDVKFTNAFPDKDWWLKFQDPYLTSYIQSAIQGNPDMNIAAQRVIQARMTVRDALSQELPQVNLNPSFVRVGLPNTNLPLQIPDSLKFYAIPLQASYELDLFGKNLDKIRSSRRQAEASEFQSRAIITSVIGEVASAYVNLQRTDALIDSQRENLALLQRVQALKESQYQAGLLSYDEVLRAQRDAAQAQTDLTSYEQKQASFAHELATLTGSPPASADKLERAPLDSLQLPAQTEAGLPSQLITRRPDILVQERLLESASLDVSAARKAFLPTINLSALWALGATNFNKIFNWDTLVDLQSIAVNQPIFHGGKLMADLKLRKAKQKEQVEQYRKTILNAFRDVEDNLSLVRAGYQTLDSNRERQTLTEKELKLTQSLYEQGLVPKLNLLQQQSELIRYQQLAVQSKADTAVATIGLYKALGGGF